MEICIPEPLKRERRQSVIEAKNKIRLGHDECCNCYCCCTPQPTCYKYVQPEVPKSFAPIPYYWKPEVPMEKDTVYQLSYWEGPPSSVEPVRPDDNLTVGDGPMCDTTTHKSSYLGNWCIKPEGPIMPCQRQWLGRGPMQDVTTQKHDYPWKCGDRPDLIPARNNIYCSPAQLCDDTTYRLSYYESPCHLPVAPFGPIRKYEKPDVPMEGCTTYRLSYWPNEPPAKEDLPWAQQKDYYPPTEPMEGCTTYKLSYWPHCEKRRDPFILGSTENLLNAGCCFDDNTTYRLSYFGCGGDKPDPIRPPGQIMFSSCPVSHDTTHRLSYFGNWCVEPQQPILPCKRDLLGRGPMQDVTTQKHDFTWKQGPLRPGIRQDDNLTTSSCPLECCTTHKLSYLPTDQQRLIPTESYGPIRSFRPPDVPMDLDTTMQLSFQPVEPADIVPKPWNIPKEYHPPDTPMEDNTTYNMSYIPPGTLVPLQPCSASDPSNKCEALPCQLCMAS